MEVIIRGEAKEIAALALATQGRHSKKIDKIDNLEFLNKLREKISQVVSDSRGRGRREL